MIGRRRDLTFEIVNQECPALTPSLLDVIDVLSSEMSCVPWPLTLIKRLFNEYDDLIICDMKAGELARSIKQAWELIDQWAEVDDRDFGLEYDKWKKQIFENHAPQRLEARKVYDSWAFFSRPDAAARTEF